VNYSKNPNEKRISFSKISVPLILILLFICIHNLFAQNACATPADAAAVKKTLTVNTEILKYNKVIYVTYCSPCRAANGIGDGIAAPGLPISRVIPYLR
jgi:hypothetical protein